MLFCFSFLFHDLSCFSLLQLELGCFLSVFLFFFASGARLISLVYVLGVIVFFCLVLREGECRNAVMSAHLASKSKALPCLEFRLTAKYESMKV